MTQDNNVRDVPNPNRFQQTTHRKKSHRANNTHQINRINLKIAKEIKTKDENRRN
ncbi:uncharacterized protein G2W53_043247 [Senna tora]|uniref:Uncharacterized protein n=1 Tax=Senna tora TaxID=362788 RepID=A0A834SIC2_9FABA|nr:uncharacterized protein G2W53_043247 [Senna tora]